jgi:hypothetical protein
MMAMGIIAIADNIHFNLEPGADFDYLPSFVGELSNQAKCQSLKLYSC